VWNPERRIPQRISEVQAGKQIIVRVTAIDTDDRTAGVEEGVHQVRARRKLRCGWTTCSMPSSAAG
jgi:hypothetical protein